MGRIPILISSVLLLGCGGRSGDEDPRAAPPPLPRFTDVTEAAGLSEPHMVLPDKLSDMVCGSSTSAGVAAADYDGDGRTDLFVTRIDTPDRLYRNRGDGTFADTAAALGVADTPHSNAASWADVDGDGDLDLYVTTGGHSRPHLYIQGPDGRFSEEAVPRGVGLFTSPWGPPCTILPAPSWADVDGDDDLDLLTLNWSFEGQLPLPFTRLFLNDGRGSFRDVTRDALPGIDNTAPYAAAFADADGDGLADLFLTADWKTGKLYRNLGGARFEDITEWAGVGDDENGMGSVVQDLDGDGDFDWFISSVYDPRSECSAGLFKWGCSGNRLYRNEGGRFVDISAEAGLRESGWGWGATAVDIDNDGRLDLAVVNGMGGWTTATESHAPFVTDASDLWRSLGSGRWENVTDRVGFTELRQGRALIVLDHDDDGDQDLFVSHFADTPVLYRNDGPARSWLRVRVRKSSGNTYGIGARLELKRSRRSPTLVRRIHADSNFNSQSPAEAHFGLGDQEGPVYSLRVSIPGRAEPIVMRRVEIDRVLTVEVSP